MAGLAAATERVRIGSLVFGNTYRHPAILANEVATIDHMSGGRVTLGLGAGWQENEHQAYGIELPPVKQRLDRFEEAVQVVKGLLTTTTVLASRATYYVIDHAPMNPGRADMKILVGGSGEKRTMRIAARVRRRMERVVDARDHAGEARRAATPLRRTRPRLRRHQGVHPGARLHERRRVLRSRGSARRRCRCPR